MVKPVIVEELVKKYRMKRGEVKALNGISFSVEKGEVFGIIGPDGAGKTSLFRILNTLLLADQGRATVNGYDTVGEYKKIRQCIGYMPGRFSLYQDLSVRENLEFFAAIFNADIQENYLLIKDIYTQIEPFRDRRAGQLSGGMKQKLALCCALIHQPEILFLDEPTTGVDAVSRKEFWEMLHRLNERGITILVSTSYMDEAGLCDRVALLQKGNILSIDTPEGIRGRFGKAVWAVRASEMFRLLNELKGDPSVESCYPFGQYHHVVLKAPLAGETDLRGIMDRERYAEAEVRPISPTIEDCFMALMKE
ncbi:MAG: ABC transporter ATP-binding protein [Bacteroidota bacterium]|nr:ABC transporter ATP-binding protein [Bacteroidota bacterium]